jgi:hypothetical protein
VAKVIHESNPKLVKFFAVRHDMILGSHGREDELLINPERRRDAPLYRHRMYERLESIAYELPHEMTRKDIMNQWNSDNVYTRLNALLITGCELRLATPKSTRRGASHGLT